MLNFLLKRKMKKHRQEMEKLHLQVRLRELEARVTEGRGKESNGNGGKVPVGKAEGKVPKMPYFDEERDSLWIVTLADLSASQRPRSGSVSNGLCTFPHC